MNLETHRISETKSPAVEIKKDFSLKDIKDMKRLIKSLPSNDIDQKWIKENESKEVSFSTTNQKNDNNQMLQDIDKQMDRLRAFEKNVEPTGMSVKELFEQKLNENKQQTIVNQPKETVSHTENIGSKQEEINSEIEKNQMPYSESQLQPIIDSVSPTMEELQQQEQVVEDNAALLKELNDRINKKYNSLILELSKLYNSEVINQEAGIIKEDLQSLMEVKERSLERLMKVDDTLNSLISRLAKLSQKADEIKTADDFGINQQQKQLNFLKDYQNQLEKKYGKYWFGKMSEQEQKEYIDLYATAYKVPGEVAKKTN